MTVCWCCWPARTGVCHSCSMSVLASRCLSRRTKRLEMVKANGKLNIMWQAPSFAVLSLGDVFTAISILEFFYDQSPSGMKSMGTLLSQLAVAAGSYLNSALIGTVAKATTRGGALGWIPDNLNEGHLDYFFWMMAALSLVNLLYFLLCSMRYRGSNTAY